MANRMLKFIDTAQALPDKRPAAERAGDFAEIYARFAPPRAADQASRCSQCGVPFCQIHCPLANNIPDWLKLAAEGRLEEAYALSAATNSMPEICGRICPQDRLCEGNCVIEPGFQSVTIGAVEKYLTDTAWEQGWVAPLRARRPRGRSVGIVGSGPAGLAVAEACREQGYGVTVYERADRAGGLLTYGIPNFKLDKAVVARRVERLAEGGVVFHLDTEIGRDLAFAELRRRHDAVLIATGVYRARDMKAPGIGLGHIVPALDFLIAQNRPDLGDAGADFDGGRLDAKGRHVVVIGGGDTAMDCVRTAVRQGAKSVKCLYRRDRANMPGSAREVAHAEEEGVEFVWLTAPEAFVGKTRVTAVQAHAMRLGVADAAGRASPQPIAGSSHIIKADLVIMALGFDAEDLPAAFAAPDLGVTRWGTVRAAFPDMATSLEGVFAAGDIVRGASLVVWAIRQGRDAAAAIDRYLTTTSAARAVAAE